MYRVFRVVSSDTFGFIGNIYLFNFRADFFATEIKNQFMIWKFFLTDFSRETPQCVLVIEYFKHFSSEVVKGFLKY